MATASAKDKSSSWICALCLEVFKEPKLLPCSHTFCRHCLEGLAGFSTRRFSCPTCREPITVPPGGVSVFKNNFYIDPEDLEKARNHVFCTTHPNRELEMFCEDCDEPICLKCSVQGHRSHEIKELNEVVVSATQEKQAINDKKTELEKNIHGRYATIVAAAGKFRDENLASLNEMVNKITDDMKEDWLKSVSRPVIHYKATAEDTFERMRDYMGSAAKMEMAVSAPEVTVDEQFRCGEDPDTDVYHVCPMTTGNVWLCYKPHVTHSTVANEEAFNTEGKVVNSKKRDPPSRVTITRRKDGGGMYPIPSQNLFCTYAKRTEPDLVRYFRLENNYKGKSDVDVEKIVSEDPFKTERETQFTINSTLHRAFDVDASEQNFVVLQEAQTPDTQRTVRLYRHSQPDAIHTYSPPVQPFQPSDVCFYRLGGEEMLLVADELNDAIHVVKVQDGRLSFARYLAPGCPLLVQPTALNTDIDGRLWVACRGGRILTCTPPK